MWGVDSLERAYLTARRFAELTPSPVVDQLAKSYRFQLGNVHYPLTHFARPRDYAKSNLAADNLYNLFTQFDLYEQGIPRRGAPCRRALETFTAGGDEYGRIVTMRHLGYDAGGRNELGEAVRWHSAALREPKRSA